LTFKTVALLGSAEHKSERTRILSDSEVRRKEIG
jgi:hypothetical protein